MWIVRLALRRPYTFVVAALVLLLLTPFVLLLTPTDIFPSIDIPVVSIIWQYVGLDAAEMEQRIIFNHERTLTTTVNDIEHVESTSYNGVGIIKVFLQPGSSVDAGVAQITAVAQTILRTMPPGATPPLIIRYNASTVPILQYSISSKKLSEQELFDLAQNQVRVGLTTVRGAAIPWPYGGRARQVSVDLDLMALKSKGLSPEDVVDAINAQNLILPSGTAKIGPTEFDVELNSSPRVLDELNDLPIKRMGGATIYVHDVAHVRDGFSPQQNIVHNDGVRGALLTIFKNGSASTLDVVRGIKKKLPEVLRTLPPGLDVAEFADQSLFVRAAISGVMKEGVVAAVLTAVMILLFIGSWRSTFIIALSIPLSVISSLVILSALGQTINLMTLGGLALAVGILVDDATVEIENVHRQMALGKPLQQAILDGAQEIALPAFVSTLCICIVFVPMFFLTGVGRYLFVPLAEAVVFAMLASYVLSRTLIPTLVMWFYRNFSYYEHHTKGHDHADDTAGWMRPFVAIQEGFERGFAKFRAGYQRLLEAVLRRRSAFAIFFLALCLGSGLLVPFLGQDFFPDVDAGQIRLHMRARTGTRVEETAKLVAEIEDAIRREIPKDELQGILDNIGIPFSAICLSYSNNGLIGTGDSDILISLKESHHHPTDGYVRRLRRQLNQEYPGVMFYFLPADIVSQTLSFGIPAPLNVQLTGWDRAKNREIAANLVEKIRHIPGAVDVRVQEPGDLPKLRFDIDRTKAEAIGLSERDVANAVLLSLSGSGQVAPAYWLNPAYGIQYLINARAPERVLDSVSALKSLSVGGGLPGQGNGQVLANVATMTRTSGSPVYSHYNVIPVIDIFGSVDGRDLGGVLHDLQPMLADVKKTLPRGSDLILRGAAETMHSSFVGLGVGLIGAIVLVYLLLVVNFQSWLDPFIIISALPGALAGVVWALYLTFTTMSVPALMGAIMSLGVATSNAVLVVTFARNNLNQGMSPMEAALTAGSGRLRPVLMTALAMIIGMLPMSLGLGEGGEQNAPLGRAVIGGLLIATVATLFFVPVVFSILHRRQPQPAAGANGETEPHSISESTRMNPMERKISSVPETTLPASAGATRAVGDDGSEPKLVRWAWLIVLLLVIALIAGFIPRWLHRAILAKETLALATPTVQVLHAVPGKATASLMLPAEVRAFVEAPIYARASGFVKKWYADIGSRVITGQLLADVDTPELDQQLTGARAELAQAEAAAALAKTTAERWATLLKTSSVSEQEDAEKQGDLKLKLAAVDTANANVHRLEDLQSFTHVTAPFAGTLTARGIDVGDLISPGKELFRLSDTSKLRVFVRVPQSATPGIANGVAAELTVPEMPAHKFAAKVVRTAGAIDANSRTLLTELEVENPNNEILSGSYAEVGFADLKQDPALVLPANTLLFRGEGPQVGVVMSDNKVELKDISIGRDFGKTIEILAGITAADRVIVNPSDSLVSGAVVRVADAPVSETAQ